VAHTKLPEGASAWLRLVSPQQVMVLSVRSPQLCRPPAETALKVLLLSMAYNSVIMSARVKSGDWAACSTSS
jgi:hypothetical protein